MRVIFFSLFSIFFLSFLSIIMLDSFTGSITTTPGCQVGCTLAFYRTLEEKSEVEKMWGYACFVNMGEGPSPSSFRKSGYVSFACMCPRPWWACGQKQFLPHPSIVTVN